MNELLVQGNDAIQIICGDTYERYVTFDGIDIDSIRDIYFSCKSLNIQKRFIRRDNEFCLSFSPSETINMKLGSATYDMTILFSDEKVKTIVYNATITILQKVNEVRLW